MALFPLQGVVDGDFVVLLVPVDDSDSMKVVGEKIRAHSVGVRVADKQQAWRVLHNGVLLDDDVTVVDAGLMPLDVVEVVAA